MQKENRQSSVQFLFEIKCISQVGKKEENNNINRSKKYNMGVYCIIMYTYHHM